MFIKFRIFKISVPSYKFPVIIIALKNVAKHSSLLVKCLLINLFDRKNVIQNLCHYIIEIFSIGVLTH